MMRRPDRAQRKLTADYLEKFSLALATAVAAKIFFAEEGITAMTIFAAVIMVVSFFASYAIVRGTDEKAKGETLRYGRRKRKNGNTERR